jgi:hypothetical protein
MTPEQVSLALGAALIVSEGLASIPQVKSNSIFQLVYNFLRMLRGGGK